LGEPSRALKSPGTRYRLQASQHGSGELNGGVTMPQDVRLWQVQDDGCLREVAKEELQKEELLENWLANDISILSDDVLVVGRQVETAFGGVIDLLCLDSNGDLVVVELKRGRTPRDIIAQVLDYASWVEDLSNEEITDLAARYLGPENPLDKSFHDAFDVPLPDVLNEGHRMVVVASEVDSSSERIIKYLSDTHGISINAVTFQSFESDQGRLLARVFLMEPEEVDYRSRTKGGSKRKPNLTYDQLQQIADERGVGELYATAVEGMGRLFDGKHTTRSSVAFIGVMEGKRNTVLSLLPLESKAAKGLRFDFYVARPTEYLSADEDRVMGCFPSELERYTPWSGALQKATSYLQKAEHIGQALEALADLKEQQS